jgi:hypothetical protein
MQDMGGEDGECVNQRVLFKSGGIREGKYEYVVEKYESEGGCEGERMKLGEYKLNSR